MEKNIKERVSQIVNDKNVKEKLTQFFQEKIVNRKAMFIPIAGVATFMLVGYAAADTEAPVIVSDQIEVTRGTGPLAFYRNFPLWLWEMFCCLGVL